MQVEEKIQDWVQSRNLENSRPLQVKFEGRLYDWVHPDVYISSLSGLDYCTYQQGLTAKTYEETGKLPAPSEDARILMEGGTERHLDQGESLGVPPEIDFTLEGVRESPKEALRRLLTSEEAHTIEFPIALAYKDINIRGRIDHILFFSGYPKIEEWKFTLNGKVKPYHLLQTKVYSYLVYRWLGSLDFEYEVKAWKWGTWNKEDQSDTLDLERPQKDPFDIVTGKFTQATVREVEASLDNANLFFTGQQECQVLPGTCNWCPHKKICKHYEKSSWVKGQLITFDETKQEAVISFEVT